jgi:hypothetical protein
MQMGRLIKLRPRRSTFYVIEETIAALHEELQFTLNYAQAMVRDREYRAAAEVIDEQRRSLVRAAKRMEEAVAPGAPIRRQPRMRVALAGAAATLALASGAFAAFGPGPDRDAPNTRIQAVEEASDALTAARGISDPLALQAIVGDAQATILRAAHAASTDPALQQSLLESVANLQTVIRNNRHVPAKVREQARKVAEQVQEIVVDIPEAEEPSAPEEPSTDADTGADAEAPKAEPSV